jgi:hypothetical protein
MGLDITTYSHLKPVGMHADGWCEDEEHVTAYAYSCFPTSFRGIPVVGQRDDFIEGGCYAWTEHTDTHQFRAGSYGGYNRWRDDLRAQFNPDTDPEKPFYELIFFADNEGTIGPDAARDLLADFRAHADQYKAGDQDDPTRLYFQEKYEDWTRGCELAADGGLIAFH